MNKKSFRIIIPVFIIAVIYAIIRYHIFKGIEWSQFPLFTMNKIIAFSGFVLIILSPVLAKWYGISMEERVEVRKTVVRTGFVMIIIHTIFSFLLFRPEVYDKFFNADGLINLTGGLSMFTGTLGLTGMILTFNSFNTMHTGNSSGFFRTSGFNYLVLAISAIHVAVIGFKGWLTPDEWPGNMPSPTLICIFIYAVVMVIIIFQKHEK